MNGARHRPASQVCLSNSVRHLREGTTPAFAPWRPEEAPFYTEDAATAFRERREIRPFRAAPGWPLPSNPTWSEDPFGLATWRLYYNSLGWLYALFYDFAVFDNREALLEAKCLIVSWMAAGDSPPADKWNDHSTAFRLANLARFDEWLRPALNKSEKELFDRFISRHAEFLIGLFNQSKYYGHNHGFMDALSVYNAAVTFKNLPTSTSWRQVSERRLNVMVAEMFTPDGINIEESIGYQQFVTRLLFDAECVLNSCGAELAGFQQTARKSLEFLQLISDADSTYPAIGDTYFAQSHAVIASYYGDETATGLARMASDKEPAGLFLYPHAGLALMIAGDPERRWKLLHKFSPRAERPYHGHHDALHFTLSINGLAFIVDSGGPYGYGAVERETYFRASRAHNVIIIDDLDFDGPVELLSAGHQSGGSWTAARVMHDDVVHTRTILGLGGTIVVHDQLTAERDHAYQLLFHLAPSAVVAPGAASRIELGSHRLHMRAFADGMPLTPKVVFGQTEPHWQGWVTRGHLHKEPAPVVVHAGKGAQLSFVTVLGTQTSPPDVVITGAQSERFFVSDEERAWDVEVSGGSVSLAPKPLAPSSRPASPSKEKGSGSRHHQPSAIEEPVFGDQFGLQVAWCGVQSSSRSRWPAFLELMDLPNSAALSSRVEVAEAILRSGKVPAINYRSGGWVRSLAALKQAGHRRAIVVIQPSQDYASNRVRQAIVIRSERLMCLLNYKVGYSSFRHFAAGFPDFEGRSLTQSHELNEAVDPLDETFAGFRRLAFVRDPISRFVSFYKDKLLSDKADPNFLVPFHILEEQPTTLLSAATFVSSIPDNFADPHWRSQALLVRHRGQLLIDVAAEIGQADDVLRELGLSRPFGIHNRSPDDLAPQVAADDTIDAATAIIRAHYADDFALVDLVRSTGPFL